jgi:hypothetical protein
LTIHHILAKVEKTAINNYRPIDEDSTGLAKRVTFVNYTGQEVVVIERTGLTHKVPPVPNRFTNQFIIRTEYTIQHYMFSDFVYQLASDINQEVWPDLFAIKEAFFIQYDENKYNYKTVKVVLDTIVEKQVINAYKGVYVTNSDLVLSNNPLAHLIRHPLSEFGLLEERFKEMTSRAGTSFTIEIVDNDHELLPRFCYLARQLFRFSPVADNTREPGIYFTIDKKTNGVHDLETFKYSLADADALGLFKTQEEAISAGDLKALRQEEIAKLNHENTRQKIELEQLKLDNSKIENELNRSIADMDLKIKQLEKENKLLDQQYQQEKIKADQEKTKADQEFQKEKLKYEQEAQKTKADYEARKADYEARKMKLEEEYSNRSYERKDTSEALKTMGIIIATGLSIIALVAKFKSN